MEEQIGKVRIDTTWISVVQDEATEEEGKLLRLAEQHTEEEIRQILPEKKSFLWEYHFSHLRENLADWLPIKRDSHVLELGAGAGALTGMLCEKAGSVTAVEASLLRCRINASRNRERENLAILAGSVPDILYGMREGHDGAAQPLYDWILIQDLQAMAPCRSMSLQNPGESVSLRLQLGSGERSHAIQAHEKLAAAGAGAYAGDPQDSRSSFFAFFRGLLAPGGHLVIASDNRLALKYWAGFGDAEGKFFTTLEMEKEEELRFSKKELTDRVTSAGFDSISWYYPYPDHIFPQSIFSDSFLPKPGELDGFTPDYIHTRLPLFSEPKVWDSIIQEGLFPEFSNAFLLVAGR